MIDTKPKSQPVPKNDKQISEAIKIGQAIIAEGKTKVEAVRSMFPLIKDEPREIIWDAFIKGAGLTEKGAITYHYNMKREIKKKVPKKD